MGVSSFEPASALGRTWRRPRVGRLVGLRPQPAVGPPGVEWSEEPGRRTPHVDVRYSLSGGIDAGRGLELSFRTRLLPAAVPASLRDRAIDHAEEVASQQLDHGTAWSRILVPVDGVRLPAEHAVSDGWEIIAFELDARWISVVASVFDAERFVPEYATFQPWPDDADGVYDPAEAPPRPPRRVRHQHHLEGEITAED